MFDIPYTADMTRDLASIARLLGATLVDGGPLGAKDPVSSVVPLADFAVVPHPQFATLVVGDPVEIASALGSGDRRDELRLAVVVVTGPLDTVPEGVTAIVDPDLAPVVVLPTLQALLATDAAAEDRAVLAATKVLALAARRSGVAGVVAELARRLDGWAVLLDRDAQPIASAGAGALHIGDAVAVAFNRPVRVRSRALQVHPVGTDEDMSAFLVVTARSGSTSRARDLSSQAAALLDLLLRTHDGSRTERLGRATMMRVLEEGGSTALALAKEWGVRERSLAAFSLSARSSSVDAERVVIHWLEDLGAPHLLTAAHGLVSGFARDEHIDEIARRASTFSVPLHLGLGSPAPVDALAGSAEEARRAHDVAVAEVRTVVRYRSMPTIDLVLDRLAPSDARRLAALLEPLRDDDLVETLRGFLAENGAWGAAAARLGVHRQTLAARVRRIEHITGLSMSSADDRAAAWLALRAHAERLKSYSSFSKLSL
jgi:purine catabolism regulator